MWEVKGRNWGFKKDDMKLVIRKGKRKYDEPKRRCSAPPGVYSQHLLEYSAIQPWCGGGGSMYGGGGCK